MNKKRITMKTRLLALAASVLLGSLVGCNGVGPRDTLLAKINDESIYREDILYMLNGGRYDHESLPLGKMLYDNYYASSALVAKALSEYPGLEKDWNDIKSSLEIRWLTTVYQDFYLGECMGFSNSELRQYYENNKEKYPRADSITGFYGVRGDVAKDYYILKHPAEYASYLKKELASLSAPTDRDSSTARRTFLSLRSKALKDSVSKNILENYHYVVTELPPLNPKSYYEKHHDQYMTVPGYELYHIQGNDSLALSQIIPENADLQAFKMVAVKNSTNKLTSADSGRVGVVKKNYAKPYGIGMLNELDSVLEGKMAGYITPVLRGDNGAFHKFFLASVVPSVLKPFDRVEPAILKSVENKELLDVDPSVVLITKDGKPVFTEADLVEFHKNFVKRPFTRRSHDWTVNMLAEHFAFADAARELRLDHEWEYRAILRAARLELLSERYMDSVVINVSEDSARVWFEKYLASDNATTKFEDVKYRMMVMASFPQVLLKRDYYTGYALMYAGKPYEKLLLNLFDRRYGEFRSTLKDRLMGEAYNSARVHLYDASIPEYKPQVVVSRLLEKADSLSKAGNKDDAYLEYRTLMFAYASVDSLSSKALLEMADIQNDQGKYDEAEGLYYAFYRIFPSHPSAEKAMFSRGFILNENLKNDSLALEVFSEFVKTYPKSEFAESATWLMDNIRSGGKLQEELSRKIDETP